MTTAPDPRDFMKTVLAMLREPSLRNGASPRREWWRRIDRFAADLNVLLVVFAIGLATLDLTFLVTQHVIDRLPQVTRVVYLDTPAPSTRQP
jgi:hypothetical protein